MKKTKQISSWKQKVLFTPGPLTTSMTVKQAMLCDVGSRDREFTTTIGDIRRRLLEVAQVADKGYEAVLLQGSGTYAVEAVISSATPPNGKWLVISNGAYGDRIADIIDVLKIDKVVFKYAENTLPNLREIAQALESDDAITHVAIVHHETTTGLINPIDEVGKIVRRWGKIYFVDAMSSFGAMPINMLNAGIDYLASTANKNLEGVPGCAFVILKKDVMLATEGYARSLTLNLLDQWRGFEKNGQFRYTPPTHCILAFRQALLELEQEGGVTGRARRYQENYQTLIDGMKKMGFKEYLPREIQGCIIVSFHYPDHPHFEFDLFYNKLSDRGYVIYPGKVSHADCFRIGTCGRIFKSDIRDLLNAIKDTIEEMEVEL